MRGRARSKKIQDLMNKFTSNTTQKRPVSESRASGKGRRRSEAMTLLAMKFEKTPPKLTNEKISQILKESKMISFPEDAVQPFLETRSNIDKSEARKAEEGEAYKMEPIYPEQIYYNRVRVEGDPLAEERKRRKSKFGAFAGPSLESVGLTVSLSPTKVERGGKRLISQSSIAQKMKKGEFMTEEETRRLLQERDEEFVDKMRDTQGNAIQKMKHAFLNQDDRILRKKLLDALRKKFNKMIVKEKTVEELQEIYKKREEENEKKKKVKDWMAITRSSQLEGKERQNMSQIGKINREMIER